MKWKPAHSSLENTTRVLPKMVAKYFKAGRLAADGKRSPDELHEFRIKTKKFRYTLELVLPVYGTALDNELEPVRELQSVLGKLHDYHIIAGMLDGAPALQAKLERRTKKKLKEFHEQWANFNAKGEEKRWKKLLGSPRAKRKTRMGSPAAARRAAPRSAAA